MVMLHNVFTNMLTATQLISIFTTAVICTFVVVL